MLLSASRRTDLPRYFSEWFMNRIRAGHLCTRNPMNLTRIYGIPLSPDTVDCIVFWTKDPTPMLPSLAELDRRGYNYYFQFTLTPYGPALEPGLADKNAVSETFAELSRRLGRRRVVWRYGIAPSSCIGRARIEAMTGRRLTTKPDKNQRPGCGCLSAIDIGAYNTCLNGCVYCYANYSRDSTLKRFAAHDPKSELLIVQAAPGETVIERDPISELCGQIAMEL